MISARMTGDRELTIYMKDIVRKTPAMARRIVGRSALLVKRNAQLNLSGRVLHVRTDKLRSSIVIAYGPDRLSAMVGTNTVYAWIHEVGGTIRPRKKKYLAIPLPGVKGSPADYPHAFVFKGKRGGLLLGIRGSYKKIKGTGSYELRGGGLRVLFVLKRQVKMPARPYMGPALEASLGGINQICEDEARKLLG